MSDKVQTSIKMFNFKSFQLCHNEAGEIYHSGEKK